MHYCKAGRAYGSLDKLQAGHWFATCVGGHENLSSCAASARDSCLAGCHADCRPVLAELGAGSLQRIAAEASAAAAGLAGAPERLGAEEGGHQDRGGSEADVLKEDSRERGLQEAQEERRQEAQEVKKDHLLRKPLNRSSNPIV